jgi:hypothetical protein
MNAIAKQLGVSTPSILNWIRVHAAQHAPRPQPEPGENVVVMELDELWHFLQKKTRTAKLTWRRHIELPAYANKLPDLV